MCVKCSITTAVNAGDWKEVKRLATEAGKGEHDDEMPLAADTPAADVTPPKEAAADAGEAKKSSKSSK